MCVLSERYLTKALQEKGSIEHFFSLERLNILSCMCQIARLCKFSRKHSNLGLKWKQPAEK